MPLPAANFPTRPARSFTLVELLVTVIIFVALIFGIALIFRTTTRAVGVSEANLELLSNVRAAQDQIARDFAGLDTSTFLIIRHRAVPPPVDAKPGAPTMRVDQVAFIAHGNFPYRVTGQEISPLGEQTAHAALIWYGHLVVEGVNNPLANTYPVADQGTAPVGLHPGRPYDIVPSGRTVNDFILGRHATLLVAPNRLSTNQVLIGTMPYPAYPMPSLFTPPIDVGESKPAQITSSRVSLACVTPAQIMERIQLSLFHDPMARSVQPQPALPPPLTELSFCFRFKTLVDPWDTDVRWNNAPSIRNGVTRMGSIFLPGVSSFAVDSAATPAHSGDDEGAGNLDEATGDRVMVFSAAGVADRVSTGPTDFPPALRITMRVADPTHRLVGGRVFQQIVKLR